jgi:hypothetical protein
MALAIQVFVEEDVGGVERVAVRAALLLRLRNTVPRKMATVTQSTPKFPQKMPLQPEHMSRTGSRAVTACPCTRTLPLDRTDNINPPAGTATPWSSNRSPYLVDSPCR